MEKRETWTDLEYYFINIGAAIGLGCIWRFPFLFYDNGGAAFLIPYTFFMIALVFPLLNLEMGSGQYFKKSLPEIYSAIHPKFQGNAYLIMLVASIFSCFYIFILTYCLIFVYETLFGDLHFLNVPMEKILMASSDYFRYDIL